MEEPFRHLRAPPAVKHAGDGDPQPVHHDGERNGRQHDDCSFPPPGAYITHFVHSGRWVTYGGWGWWIYITRFVHSAKWVRENNANPFAERKSFVTAILAKAEVVQKIDERTLHRAERIEKSYRIPGLDALHLACAEQLKAVFITCDDKILKRYSGNARVQNPVDFAWQHVEG